MSSDSKRCKQSCSSLVNGCPDAKQHLIFSKNAHNETEQYQSSHQVMTLSACTLSASIMRCKSVARLEFKVTAQQGDGISQAASIQPLHVCHMTFKFAGSDALSDPASGELECELVLGESFARPSFLSPAWLWSLTPTHSL